MVKDYESFNPYSTGFYSFIKDNEVLLNYVYKFQSLFYWILFFYRNKERSYKGNKEVSILILLDSILL